MSASQTSQGNILLAEDDPKVCDFVEIALNTLSYKVTVTKEGRETLMHLQQHTPDVVILGVDMPHLRGLEVASRMRRVKRLQDVPIIVISSQNNPRLKSEADMAKVNVLLRKPFSSQDIIAVIERLRGVATVESKKTSILPPSQSIDAIARQAMPSDAVTIMVVEDSEALRSLIVDILRRQGYRVESAENVPQAQALINKKLETVQLVMLDITMPGGSGFELLQHIRLRSDVPVLVLSGIEASQGRRQALELGAQDYISKPFNPKDLLRRIREQLEQAAASKRKSR